MDKLRREIRLLRAKKDLAYLGSLTVIHIGINGLSPAINYQSLSMAMTGHRKSKASRKILERVKEFLDGIDMRKWRV